MTRTQSTPYLAIVVLTTFAGCSGQLPRSEALAGRTSIDGTTTVPRPTRLGGGPAGTQRVTGTVLETMDASNYTYVRVKTESEELWAAASTFKVAVGDTVVVSLDQPMENFHSRALNRDFALIYFVERIAPEDAGSPRVALGHTPTDPPVTSALRTTSTPTEAAGNATTVEAVWKTRTALSNQKVTVRGKIVKYNAGILGMNWIHIQDGTGNAADGSNDITAT